MESALFFGIIYLTIMSIFPRKFHGPELKCGGPQMCPDCKERAKLAKECGLPWDQNPYLKDWYDDMSSEIIKKDKKPSENEEK